MPTDMSARNAPAGPPGTKLRICGAELASPGPGEPLEAAKSGWKPVGNQSRA